MAESLETELAQADMVVLAVPVLQIIDLLGQVGKHLRAGAVVTDVGSTERRIVDAMASRLAAGDPLMTAEMLASNADNLNAAVGELVECLRDLARTVVDPVSLADGIAGARALRESLLEEPAG